MIKIGVFGGTSCSREATDYAWKLGQEIAKSRNILVTGGVGGIGNSAVQGAIQFLKTEDLINNQIIHIVPLWNEGKEEKMTKEGFLIKEGLNWSDRQRILVSYVDCGLSISGGGGTGSEIMLIKEANKPFIAIAGEGASDKASDGRFSQRQDNQEELVQTLLKEVMK